jgi:uncharacterized protein (TIGR02147 family)
VKSVFEYEDYRRFLRDFYEEKKRASASYSFRYFARKAGLGSPNYLKLVTDGDRNLTHHNVRKFIDGLGLDEREGHYFENLVYFNQAKDPDEKEFFRRNLELVKLRDGSPILTPDQHQALGLWYPFAIKELALLPGFQPKPKWIAARLDHKITPQQAKEALELLVRLKLLEADPATGELRVTDENLKTPDVTRSDAVTQYHDQMLERAREALHRQSHEKRCFSAVTVAVRKKDLPKAFERLHQFRNELNAHFGKSKPYDAVYQLNLHLFRVDDDV